MLSFRKLAIIFTAMFIFGIFFGFFLFPKQVELRPKSDTRDIWSAPPFPIDFIIYVFNITNPEEVQNGGKVKVQEIGPFFFDEWKEKYDQIDDDEEDTITYNLRNTYIFRPDKSNGLTGDEIITLPHAMFQGAAILVQRERAALMEMVSKGLPIIFSGSKATLTGTFMDIFFNGILVDCSSEDFNALGICTEFHSGDVKTLQKYNETHFLFSLMGALNATNVGKIKVYRGIKNIENLGMVVEVDEEPDLDNWNGDNCNNFKGTDSTIFPPFMRKDRKVIGFLYDFCRDFHPHFVYETKYDGLPSWRYTVDFGDIKNDEDIQCFCGDNGPPDDCPVKGTMNMMRCLGAPLICSLPHFYNGDESLFENVEGLQPEIKKHETFVHYEKNSGLMFELIKRIQFNFDQEPVKEIEELSKLRKMVIPMFWAEEGFSLNSTWTDLVKPIFYGIIFNQFLRWSCIIIGSLGLIICILLDRNQSDITTKIHQKTQQKVEPKIANLISRQY